MPQVYTIAIEKKYEDLFGNMVIKPGHEKEIDSSAKLIISNKSRYESVAKRMSMPWQMIGIFHYLECSCSFEKHLHNGDPLTARTVRAPEGRPLIGMPPFKWEDSAFDALEMQGLLNLKWSIGQILFQLERYNGFTMWSMGLNTPYLWSYTNHYDKGKFIEEKDENGKYIPVFKPDLISKQVGAAVLLRYLTDKTLGYIK